MAYLEDLSKLTYTGGDEGPNIYNVGWLSGDHKYTKGAVLPEVEAELKRLIEKPMNKYRGWHECELCKGQYKGPANGEIRIARNGITYVAPVMICHYVRDHGYQPPTEFTEAILEILHWRERSDAERSQQWAGAGC